ncbi:MAG: hypothetical protein CL663_07645 [Bacteroidetes bacterium]|nr:hypothetical protein [Bacteroidota bacterium]
MYKLFIKDLKLFFIDKKAVMLTFLLPIIIISLFAFAFGGLGGKRTSQPIDLLVSDLDQSASSQKIIAKLDSLEGLGIKIKEIEWAKDQVIKGNYVGVLVFNKGFDESLKNNEPLKYELLYDEAREMEVGMLQPVLIGNLMESVGKESITQNISSYMDDKFPGMSSIIKDQIISDVTAEGGSASFEANTELTMTSLVGEEEESSNLGLVQAVAGTAILMLLFSVSAMAAVILEEKENGTLKRLLYSPITANDILYGKMLIAFFISLLQLTIMFVFAWLAFGLKLFVNPLALALVIIATAFAVSGFGMFLASISKTRQQAAGLSMLIILTMSAIGGSMVPLYIMPAIMKKIAIISVNYWGIQAFYDIFWRELPTIDILPKIGVLIGIGIVMTLISIPLFKKNIIKLV